MEYESVYKRMFDQKCEECEMLIKSIKGKDRELVKMGSDNAQLRRTITQLNIAIKEKA